MYRHNLDGIPEQLHPLFMSSRICMKGDVPYTTLSGWQLAKLAREIYEETQPLRDVFMQDYLGIAGGGAPRFTGTMYAGMKGPIEAQYQAARENLFSALPQGGALFSELANLETQRAQGLQGVLQDIWSDQIAKMYGWATGAPQTSIAGLSGASQAEQAMQQLKTSNEQAKMSGIAGGFGK